MVVNAKMIVACFDLSSKCTGVAVAVLDKKNLVSLKTTSIIPTVSKDSAIKELGYSPKKKRISQYLSYVRSPDERPSKTESMHRNSEVRNAINAEIRKYIAVNLQLIISTVSPDLVVVERNESFGGVLTTKFLAEIRGILEGAASNIPIKQYSVSEMRKKFNMSKMTREYVDELLSENKVVPADITKNVLKKYVDEKYGICTNNTDESDACIVFDHYYETEVKNNECNNKC